MIPNIQYDLLMLTNLTDWKQISMYLKEHFLQKFFSLKTLNMNIWTLSRLFFSEKQMLT